MTRAVEIRNDVATAAEFRQQAEREPRRQAAMSLLAVANALDGMNLSKRREPPASSNRLGAMPSSASTPRASLV
jgi:hypothetical protein